MIARRKAWAGGLVATTALILTLTLPGLSTGAAAERSAQTFQCRMRATRLAQDIRVVFTLNSQIARRGWRLRLWNNDALQFAVARRADAAGHLRIRKVIDNQVGRDHLRAGIRDAKSGSVCRVALRVW